jgi:hypothetical protein
MAEEVKGQVLNGVIFTAKEPLAALLKEKFPVTASLELIKLSKAHAAKFQIIEEARNGLIQKYGDEIPNGGIGLVGPNDPDGRKMSQNWVPFVKELNELFSQESELVFTKVKLPKMVTVRCDKCRHVIETPLEIEPASLMALEPFVEFI